MSTLPPGFPSPLYMRFPLLLTMLTLKADISHPITCGHLGRHVQAPATLTTDVGLFGHRQAEECAGGEPSTLINRPRQRFAQAVWAGVPASWTPGMWSARGAWTLCPLGPADSPDFRYWNPRGLQLSMSIATPSSFHLQKQAVAQGEIVPAARDNTKRCFKMNMA